MQRCLITVGITCFNAEETIERAVLSAIAQTWTPLEILVIDDASTDGSVAILERLQKEHSIVRFIRNEKNAGVATARNILFDEAQGDFVCIFDDDDYSVPERVSEQYQRSVAYEKTKNTEFVLCYCNRDVVKKGCRETHHIARGIGLDGLEPHGTMVAEFILGIGGSDNYSWGLLGSCTLMLRKSAFTKVGAFDSRFRRCAEWDFATRAALLGAHFISVDKSLITQYKTDGLGEEKTDKTSFKYRGLLLQKHKQFLLKNNAYWAAHMVFRARHLGSKGQHTKCNLFMIFAYLLSPSLLKRKVVEMILSPINKIFGK